MDNPTLFRETIFALSSGALPSGVAVIRLSGPRVEDILNAMIGEVPPARKAVLRAIKNRNGQLLDMGLVLYFKGPNSFTGEDAAELEIPLLQCFIDTIGQIKKIQNQGGSLQLHFYPTKIVSPADLPPKNVFLK